MPGMFALQSKLKDCMFLQKTEWPDEGQSVAGKSCFYIIASKRPGYSNNDFLIPLWQGEFWDCSHFLWKAV